MTYVALESSIYRILIEARMSYVYGFFQSVVFLIGAITELLTEETIRIKDKWSAYETKYPQTQRWLGTLIKFCQDEGIMSTDTLQDLKNLNRLRIEAVHMDTEKKEYKTPSEKHPLVEIEDISVYEPGGRVRSRMIPMGEPLLIDASNPAGITFKTEHVYKPQAESGLVILSRVFISLRKLQKQIANQSAGRSSDPSE